MYSKDMQHGKDEQNFRVLIIPGVERREMGLSASIKSVILKYFKLNK